MPTVERDCAFCRIVGKEAPAQLVAEGSAWMAFFPINPATLGHTLVIPRMHVEDFWSAEPPLNAELTQACLDVGRAIQKALRPEGMNLVTSAGRAAEQTVFHLHLHLVPRWHDDGFGRIWPTGDRYSSADLLAPATSISQQFRRERSDD